MTKKQSMLHNNRKRSGDYYRHLQSKKLRQYNKFEFKHINVRKQYYKPIVSGSKTAEIRLGNNKFCNNLKLGDYFMFSSQSNVVVQDGENSVAIVEVTKISKFSTFKAALENIDFKTALPDAKNIEEAVNVYHSIKGFKMPSYGEQESRHGAIVVQFNLIKILKVQPGDSKEKIFQDFYCSLNSKKIAECCSTSRLQNRSRD